MDFHGWICGSFEINSVRKKRWLLWSQDTFILILLFRTICTVQKEADKDKIQLKRNARFIPEMPEGFGRALTTGRPGFPVIWVNVSAALQLLDAALRDPDIPNPRWNLTSALNSVSGGWFRSHWIFPVQAEQWLRSPIGYLQLSEQDKVVVLEQGRIVEQGGIKLHWNSAASSGKYHQIPLWLIQAGQNCIHMPCLESRLILAMFNDCCPEHSISYSLKAFHSLLVVGHFLILPCNFKTKLKLNTSPFIYISLT